MKIQSFRELNIWQLGKQIVLNVYDVSKDFPLSERFGLVTQMQRAAVSIPSNIAEGFNRFQNKEYRRFLYITLGSCAELETQVEISFDLKYITEEKRNCLIDQIDHESRMITNLIKRL